MYSPNIGPESKVRESLTVSQARGFSGKLPMTEDEGHIFVEYTVVAVVHRIAIYILWGRQTRV